MSRRRKRTRTVQPAEPVKIAKTVERIIPAKTFKPAVKTAKAVGLVESKGLPTPVSPASPPSPNPLDTEAPVNRPWAWTPVGRSCKIAFKKSYDQITADSRSELAKPEPTLSQRLALLGQQYTIMTLKEELLDHAKTARLKRFVAAAALPSTPTHTRKRRHRKRAKAGVKKSAFPIVRSKDKVKDTLASHSTAVKARKLKSSLFKVRKKVKPLKASQLKRVREWQDDSDDDYY